MTTGITDVEWLDSKVCELSDLNEKLNQLLKRIECEMRYAGWNNIKSDACIDNEQRNALYNEILGAIHD